MRVASILLLVGPAIVACGEEAPTEIATDLSESHSSSSGGGQGPGDLGSSGGANSDAGSVQCIAVLATPKKPKVDIIFAIDSSDSMRGELDQVRTNINTFAQKIGGSGLDYNVIVLGQTGTGGICAPAPLGGANCGDNPPRYHHVRSLFGARALLATVLSSYDTGWKQYTRPEAFKIFVAMSDANSDTPATSFDRGILAKDAVSFGTETQRRYMFHSIVGWVPGTMPPSSQTCSGASGSGIAFQQLSVLTGGIVESVCRTDYSGVMDNLAGGIQRLGCKLEVPPTVTAKPDSMVVQTKSSSGAITTLTQVTDVSKCESVMNGWYYDDNAKPTNMILCKSTCSGVIASQAEVQGLVGCAAPPPR